MSRETLKEYLGSIGKLDVDKVSYVIDTSENTDNKDLGEDPNSGMPIIKEESSLSGDYVKFITQASRNTSTFKSGNDINPSYKRSDNLTLSDQSSVSDPYVAPEQMPQNYSNSGLLTDNSNLSNFVDKIGESPGLYSDTIKELTSDSDLVGLTTDSLKDNNRFFSNDTIRDFSNNQDFTSQNEYGNFNKNTLESQVTSYEKLRYVGRSILLSQGGWISHDDGKVSNVNPSEISLDADKVPELSLGLGVDYDSTKARYAFDAPQLADRASTREGKNLNESELENIGQSFYNDKFNYENIGNSKLSKTLCVSALRSIFSNLEVTVTAIINATPDSSRAFGNNVYQGRGPHETGEYRATSRSKAEFLTKQLFVYTEYAFKDCFSRGIEVCFGIKDFEKIGNMANADGLTAINNTSIGTLAKENTSFWNSILFSFTRV